MRLVLLFLFLIANSSITIAETKSASSSALFKLMHQHLSAMKAKNEVELKKTVTRNYFKLMSKDGQLKELFDLQKDDHKKIDFDIVFKELSEKQNQFLVNIKDKDKKEYDDHWFVIVMEDGKLKISKTQHLEE